MPLNARQQRFATEYTIDLNATQAAIRAGYSPRTAGVQGYALLRLPQIAALVAKNQIATMERVAGSADWIVEQAVTVVRLALASETPDLRAVVPALSLLAKRHPEFSEKHDVNINARTQVLALVAGMTDEQLAAAKARLA